ncbi:MAG: hypothetical protein WD029_06610 [Microthrixaceae bacterium]
MKLDDLYQCAPLQMQNLFATAYGLKELPRRHGGQFRREVFDLDVRQWWNLDELQLDQDARLRSMVTWCAHRVPHYRDLFSELGVSASDIRTAADLAQLPLLDKETVRADPDRFLPDQPLPKLIAQTTGGTTGTPVRYWATLSGVRANYATYEARCRSWAGVKLGQRMASFHGQPIIPASQQGGPYWRRNLAFNQLYFSVYHLNSITVPAYLNQLEQFQPQVIAGYTSAVHRIARGLIDSGDIGRVRPTAVMVSSETLTPAVRQDIQLAFGCRVTNAYSLGELVAFISECDHGELHISTEYGIVELLDQPDSAGSEIIATGLINKGMPLLRYRTGDLAVRADPGPSACGRGLPCVAEIIGRVDDVVRTPEGATVGPAPMSLAFQRVPHLRRAQVRQDSIEELTVLLEVDPAFGSQDEEFLLGELKKRLGPSIRFVIEHVPTLPRTSGGKERLVVSSLSPSKGSL